MAHQPGAELRKLLRLGAGALVAGALVAAALAWPAGLHLTAASAQSPGVIGGLSLYDAGAHAEALASVQTLADVQAVHDTLAVRGATWIDSAATPADARRRRLVAATFALDVAFVPVPATDSVEWVAERDLRLSLLAWGGAALTTQIPVFRRGSSARDRLGLQPPTVAPPQNVPAQPAERLWFRAAIAVAQSFEAWEGLIDLPSFMQGDARSARLLPPGYHLVPFALARFPDDPYLRLDQAMAEERLGCSPSRCALGTLRAEGAMVGSLDASTLAIFTGERRALLERAATHYKAIADSPVVGAEANLRYGFTQVMLGRRSAARTALMDAGRVANDAFVGHLSQLFLGAIAEEEGKTAEAEAAFRAALAAAPASRSASIRLAALLAAAGRGSESMALLDTSLFSDPAPPDPWVMFRSGEGHRALELVNRAREALR